MAAQENPRTKALLRYGDPIQLENKQYHNIKLLRGKIETHEGHEVARVVPTDTISNARLATWRVLPGSTSMAQLGEPVFLGDLVQLRNLEDEDKHWYLNTHRSSGQLHDVFAADAPGQDTDWIFQDPDAQAGAAMLVDSTMASYRLSLAKSLDYMLATNSMQVYMQTDRAGAQDDFWFITTHYDVDVPTQEPDVRNLVVGPGDIYDKIGPKTLDAAVDYVAHERDRSESRIPGIKEAIKESVPASVKSLPWVTDTMIDSYIDQTWSDALTYARASDTDREAAKRTYYVNAMNGAMRLMRRPTTKAERMDKYEKLVALLDNEDDKKMVHDYALPYLQDELPELELHGDIPEKPRELRKRSTGGGGTPIELPEVHEMPLWLDIAMGVVSVAATPFGLILNASRGFAAWWHLTIGVGQELGGGIVAGGSFGAGLIATQQGRWKFYGSAGMVGGLLFSVSLTWQFTFVVGNENDFSGPATLYAVSGGEFLVANGGLLCKQNGQIFGATCGLGLGLGSPFEFYMGVPHTGHFG